jgi:hypothetical protein
MGVSLSSGGRGKKVLEAELMRVGRVGRRTNAQNGEGGKAKPPNKRVLEDKPPRVGGKNLTLF